MKASSGSVQDEFLFTDPEEECIAVLIVPAVFSIVGFNITTVFCRPTVWLPSRPIPETEQERLIFSQQATRKTQLRLIVVLRILLIRDIQTVCLVLSHQPNSRFLLSLNQSGLSTRTSGIGLRRPCFKTHTGPHSHYHIIHFLYSFHSHTLHMAARTHTHQPVPPESQ